MATVEEVKAGVARFGDETTRQVAQIRAVANSLDQTSAMLRGITTGTNHARVAEALAQLEQVKRRLAEAATLAQGAVESTKSYVASF